MQCPKCEANPRVKVGTDIALMQRDLQTVSKSGKTFYVYYRCTHCGQVYRKGSRIETLRK
jgi:uncharacterized Zn finger protein